MALTTEERENAAAIIRDWPWQIAEGHNYRFKQATNTLVRFYEAAPMEADEFKLVLEYLKSQDNITSIELNHKSIDLEGIWRAKDAWYATSADKHDLSDTNRVRVYQVLVGKSEADAADGPYTIEDGCQYKIEHTFYWDVEEAPVVPASSSGVSYAIQGVSRDKETGLFSYVLECRVRVQQDVAEYTTASTAFETSKEELHLGVKADKLTTTGQNASVSNGKKVTRRVTKNADCTSDVQNLVTEEKNVKSSRKTIRKTLRGSVTSITDRSESAALTEQDIVDGETRVSELTDGERYNNTIEKASANPQATPIQSSKEKSDAYETDTTIESVPIEQFEDEIEIDLEQNEEAVVSFQKNEDGVTADKRTVKRKYHPKKSPVMTSGSKALKTETTVGINQPTVPSPGVGGTNVVKRVNASLNDHGSFSVQETTETHEAATTGDMAAGSAKLATTTKVSINQTEIPTVGKGGVNVVKRISATPNEMGSFSVQETTETHEAATTGDMAAGSAKLATTTKVSINQTEIPTVGKGGVNVVKRISATPNEMGSFSVQETTETHDPREAEISWKSGGGTHTYKSFHNQESVPKVKTPNNGSAQASVSQNQQGSYDGVIHTFEPDSGEAVAGSILKQTWDEKTYETKVLPGGRERRREVTINITEGYCALSSAYVQFSKSEAYKNYVGFVHPAGPNNGFYRRINSVTFGIWENVK